MHDTPSLPQWKKDWAFWFRLSMITCLLVWSSISRAVELESPRPEQATDLPVLINPDATEEENQAPPAVKEGASDLRQLPLPRSGEMPVRPQTSDTPTVPGELMPLPLPSSTENKRPEPGNAPQVASESEAAQRPTWKMLITPGASHAASVASQPRLVTFELDPTTGLMTGSPTELPVQFGPDPNDTLAIAEHHSGEGGTSERHPRIVTQPESPVPGKSYESVYNSIPYSRAEYLANPAYRHEATMEMLFGHLRPTTIHKHDTPRRIYNLPQIHEDPRPIAPAMPLSWYSPYFGPGRYYAPGYGLGWTPNSTYRRYQTTYGPLFNSYYQPLTRPWGW